MKLVNGMAAIEGDGSYKIDVLIDLDKMDLIMHSAVATYWNDKETRCGVDASMPLSKFCSLPQNDDISCRGSAIPRLPCYTQVTATSIDGTKRAILPMVDVGPAAPNPQNGENPDDVRHIDLTPAAYNQLGGRINSPSDSGHILVDVRIHGAAKYLGAEIIEEARRLVNG